MSNKMTLVRYVLVALIIGGGISACGENVPIEEEFAGPWERSFDRDITVALSDHGARDCGEYVYKESKTSSGYYLVYCTADRKEWSSYKVWLPIGKAEGPFKIHPQIPPPGQD